jgi:hypothetical protein
VSEASSSYQSLMFMGASRMLPTLRKVHQSTLYVTTGQSVFVLCWAHSLHPCPCTLRAHSCAALRGGPHCVTECMVKQDTCCFVWLLPLL